MARRQKRKTFVSAAVATPAEPLTDLQRRDRRLRLDASRAAKVRDSAEPPPEQVARFTYVSARTYDPVTGFPIVLKRKVTVQATARWHARGMLTDRQYDACVKYRDIYDACVFERSIIGNYSGAGSTGDGSNMTGMLAANIAQLDAREAFREARKVLPGRLYARFEAVVLREDEAQAVGEREGLSGTGAARFAVEWVRICADELADWFRLPG